MWERRRDTSARSIRLHRMNSIFFLVVLAGLCVDEGGHASPDQVGYHMAQNYADMLASASDPWVKSGSGKWELEENRRAKSTLESGDTHWQQSVLRDLARRGHRILIYGASWGREVYKSLARRALQNTSHRYDRALNVPGVPNPDRWGRQWGDDAMDLGPWDERFYYCRKPGGCGVGVDFESCGRPGQDDLGSLAYASKSYINSSRWDAQVRHWALASKATFVILEAHVDWTFSHTWGCVPPECHSGVHMAPVNGTKVNGRGPCADLELASLIEHFSPEKHGGEWWLILVGAPRNVTLPPRSIVFNFRNTIIHKGPHKFPYAADVIAQSRPPPGHGFSGPITDEWGGLLLQLCWWLSGRSLQFSRI